ncbi:hypothetical protein IFM89_018180 [Coptis chinensis]|uniref:Methyltransferase n=1 Tax=Coptis chinensis TaxID=261450 RepID=A0A835I4Z5_9MAGN|nr:hypothetical protein IFM89_018180 [Coptis chinensis]
MKGLNSSENLIKTPLFIKITALIFISFTFFYFGTKLSNSSTQLVFFSSKQHQSSSQSISLSPNINKTLDLNTLNLNQSSIVIKSPPPPPLVLERLGVIDDNGTMAENFEIGGGEFDPNLVEDWGGGGGDSDGENGDVEKGSGESEKKVKVEKFKLCDESMREYIPCLDNVEEIKKLKSTEKGEKYERHCPGKGKELNCLVPAPKDYKTPIPWPRSRDEGNFGLGIIIVFSYSKVVVRVWFSNVPHTRLVEDKGGQNWISREKDKFTFPGGGTQFIHGANQYLDQISSMIPEIAFGKHTRVVLDVGCGVASFGAFLFSRNVTTLSIAPKDVHENQIQFALERGVPAMVAAFATHRLLYPSQAFDLIHCSRCRINWTRDALHPQDLLIILVLIRFIILFACGEDGVLLLEVNRILRAGGYFAWAAQPVYKHEENLQEQWKEMEDLTVSLCWQLVKKEGYIALWQKPLNNSCYVSRNAGARPPLCDEDDNPDDVWYVPWPKLSCLQILDYYLKLRDTFRYDRAVRPDLEFAIQRYKELKSCITRLPENNYGANVTTWPVRLHYPPERLQSIGIDAYISRKELFNAESKYWCDIIESYVRAYHWKKLKLRNVMDMRAGFGGFAAALLDLQLDSWVMNVVPVSGPNTLPVIYDRGLIGVIHDWCEPFDTYPRTYDLLHANGLFTVEKKRCKISTIMLEMDRMLRPGGRVYIRDSVSIMDELVETAKAMGWQAGAHDTAEGPHASYKVLMCDKHLLR